MWRISISRSGVLKVRSLRNRPRTQVKRANGYSRQELNLSATAQGSSERSSCASLICGEIRIKKIADSDKNASVGPALQSRSCFLLPTQPSGQFGQWSGEARTPGLGNEISGPEIVQLAQELTSQTRLTQCARKIVNPGAASCLGGNIRCNR